MWLFKRIFKKRGKGEIFGKKQELKHLALKKIGKIEREKFSEQALNEFFFVFKVFIRKIFSLKKQITHEELTLALKEKRVKKSVKEKIIKLSSEINEIEYQNEEIDKEEFKKLVIQFKEIIKSI